MKVKKSIVIGQTVSFAVLRSLLLVYYLHLHQRREIGFWRMLLGGIEAIDGKYILYVVIYIFPDFLFYYYVSSKYIRQLKESYVYIFVRERNMKRWLREFTARSLLGILLYEIVTVVILLLAGLVMQETLAIQVGEFITIILCWLVKQAVIFVFCNMLLFRFHEAVSVYANLLVQAFPFFCVGVLYDIGADWEMAVECIPFNWCNYNYLVQLKINPFVMVCLSVVLGVVMHLFSEKLFHDYEAV